MEQEGDGVVVVKLALMIMAASVASVAAADTPVPAKMQGVWAKNGRCDRLKDRLTITAHRAGWGNGPFDGVYFEPHDPGPSIHYNEEGVVSNFEPGSTPNVLIFNPEGYHMPGREAYVRCGRKMTRVRVPWR